jgi:hypothetical protein
MNVVMHVLTTRVIIIKVLRHVLWSYSSLLFCHKALDAPRSIGNFSDTPVLRDYSDWKEGYFTHEREQLLRTRIETKINHDLPQPLITSAKARCQTCPHVADVRA